MAAQPKFTPGPWTIKNDGDGGYAFVEILGANKMQQVAQLESADGFEEMTEADARLIAAAPDLYAALTAYRSVIAMLPVRMMQDLSKWKGFTDAQIAGAVALAKAEGRDA